MGLDVAVHNNLQAANGNEAFDETGKVVEGFIRVCQAPGYEVEDRCHPLKDNQMYKNTLVKSFRAGSYTCYMDWRDWLAKLSGWPLGSYDSFVSRVDSYAASAWGSTGGPFWELLDFSDIEGVIGATASRKLAGDFAQYQSVVDASMDEGSSYHKELYRNFREAFETASDNGMVRFY